jgi:hypothetical protein
MGFCFLRAKKGVNPHPKKTTLTGGWISSI